MSEVLTFHENDGLLETDLTQCGLELLNRGKVRDIYTLDGPYLLIITTDRMSAFDVVLPQPIPEKGAVLTRLSEFWMDDMEWLVPNHLTDRFLVDIGGFDRETIKALGDRAIIVSRLQPLPIEAIVRGYLIGSGWKDYQRTGAVCGIVLPKGLRQAEQLPEVLFTPSTKAADGDHDENIDFETMVGLLGGNRRLADHVRKVSIRIYQEAARYAAKRGIIIADTKFEFGLDKNGNLHLIDEVLTPDSSRFWPADQYRVGTSPPSFDKQFVRDYLETLDWNKQAPAPDLPNEIVAKTAEKYAEAERRLMEGMML